MKHNQPTPRAIRRRRKKLNLTQAQASQLIGIAQSQWARYETGTRTMSAGRWLLWRIVSDRKKA